jgi:3-oxoadipate enol-lactonase
MEEQVVARRHEIEVPGGLIVADEIGEGSPLILIHSASVDRRSWDEVANGLAQAGYRAIRYDMRGFGESTSEEVDFAGEDDLIAVLDALNVGQVAVVGNSLGTAFALDAILAHPERFVAFIWIGGGVGGFRAQDEPKEALAFAAASAAREGDDLDLITAWNLHIWLDGVGQSATRVPAQLREKVRLMNRPLMEKARVFGNVQRPDPAAVTRLGELRLPVTAIVGDLDTHGTKEAARLLAAEAGAHLITLPGVAHFPGMEMPDRIVELIVEAVGSISPWN